MTVILCNPVEKTSMPDYTNWRENQDAWQWASRSAEQDSVKGTVIESFGDWFWGLIFIPRTKGRKAFYSLRSMITVSFFSCCDKTLIKTTWGGKGLSYLFPDHSPSLREVMAGTQSGNLETGSLAILCSIDSNQRTHTSWYTGNTEYGCIAHRLMLILSGGFPLRWL